jgi:hypothetical protein
MLFACKRDKSYIQLAVGNWMVLKSWAFFYKLTFVNDSAEDKADVVLVIATRGAGDAHA